jgi:CHAP domain-containing protein
VPRGWIPFVLTGLIVALVVFAWDGSCSVEAQAAKRHDRYPLHIGSSGVRVKNLQWLLGAHKPAVRHGRYWRVLNVEASGYFGKGTREAVFRIKLRLGYPHAGQCGSKYGLLNGHADQKLLQILKGGRPRPGCWVKLAARRVPPPCTMAQRIVNFARREIGNREIWGRNYGPRIALYQAVTGAFRAPWCVSWAQAIYKWSGLGTFANRSASVYYVLGYASRRGWLRSRPQPGDLIAFRTWQGHMGIVDSVTRGGFYAVEGNSADRVLRRFHPYGARPASFISIPGIDRRVKCS